jgi:hypothetical protein
MIDHLKCYNGQLSERQRLECNATYMHYYVTHEGQVWALCSKHAWSDEFVSKFMVEKITREEAIIHHIQNV